MKGKIILVCIYIWKTDIYVYTSRVVFWSRHILYRHILSNHLLILILLACSGGQSNSSLRCTTYTENVREVMSMYIYLRNILYDIFLCKHESNLLLKFPCSSSSRSTSSLLLSSRKKICILGKLVFKEAYAGFGSVFKCFWNVFTCLLSSENKNVS